MSMQTSLTPSRLGKFKGEIIGNAVPNEILCKQGRQIKMPKNQSETYVARRYVPYGATASNPNQFFSSTAGDRGAEMVNAHLTQEGVTPSADSIVPVDVSATIKQYSCLYSFTDKVADIHEDGESLISEMAVQIGNRISLVNELIVYGELKSCTNVFYGGTGTSIATVNSVISLNMIRKITRVMQANHARPITKILGADKNVATEPVEAAYVVVCHTDLEPDLRNIAGFIPASQYASGKTMEGEIGRVERFRFITTPDLPATLSGAISVTASGTTPVTQATIDTHPDVYPFFVFAENAFSQIALRGKESASPTFIPANQKTKSDPHGQRGYSGSTWWKGVLIENNQWMAIGWVCASAL